jgi:hypothetical protein
MAKRRASNGAESDDDCIVARLPCHDT